MFVDIIKQFLSGEQADDFLAQRREISHTALNQSAGHLITKRTNKGQYEARAAS